MSGAREIRLHVAGYPDSDPEERAELAEALAAELRDLDVDEVSRPRTAAPPGAKGSGLEWAQLAVTLAGSMPPLVAVLRSWTGRHRGASVTLEDGEESLTFSDPPTPEQRERIEAWLRRHDRG